MKRFVVVLTLFLLIASCLFADEYSIQVQGAMNHSAGTKRTTLWNDDKTIGSDVVERYKLNAFGASIQANYYMGLIDYFADLTMTFPKDLTYEDHKYTDVEGMTYFIARFGIASDISGGEYYDVQRIKLFAGLGLAVEYFKFPLTTNSEFKATNLGLTAYGSAKFMVNDTLSLNASVNGDLFITPQMKKRVKKASSSKSEGTMVFDLGFSLRLGVEYRFGSTY